MTISVFLFVVLGLSLGSFGNVVVLRSFHGESLTGRSRCRSCKRTLGFFDLIPVLSYVLLGGRCRRCHAHIPLQYPIVEFLSGVLFGLSAMLFPSEIVLAIFTALLLYALLLSAVFDVLHQRLPDALTISIAVLALVISFLEHHFISSLIGLLIAFTWFGGQWILSRGRAVGTGDIWLASALGLWLGWRGTVAMLLLSYSTGAIVVLFLLAIGTLSFKRERIAFGPFLGVGAVLEMLGVGQVYFTML